MIRLRVGCICLATMLLLGIQAEVSAETGGCDYCGCDAGGCRTICRLEKTEKTVDVTCWACKSEEFCIPGKSHRNCKHCEMMCMSCGAGDTDDCGCNQLVPRPRKRVWYSWIPGCARVQTRKKLYRKTTQVKIPTYKWVVERVCPACEAHIEAVPIGRGATTARPPVAESKFGLNSPSE